MAGNPVDEEDGRPRVASRTSEPDYRFTLANERTFLAWMRTGLALLAVAVAAVQLAPDLGSARFRETCGTALAALAACVSAGGVVRWMLIQRAISEGRALRRGALPIVLATGLSGVALAVVFALVREIAT